MITEIRLWLAARAVARAEAERVEDETLDAWFAVLHDSKTTGRRRPLRQMKRRTNA